MITNDFDKILNNMWEPHMEASHMLRTSITRKRLRKSKSKQQPDKHDFHGNQQS
jgi:hypothetical protein